jgi:hypothetical protein
MIRIALSLCVISLLLATATACGSKRQSPQPDKAKAISLCQSESTLQTKLRIFRSDSSGRNLVAVGKARGQVFIARRNLGSLVGADQIAQAKLKWCSKLSRDYLAISNKRVIRAARSLCREVRIQRSAKRNDIVVIDSIVEPLKYEYRWHSEWYDEDAIRANSVSGLPAKAKPLKQVLRSC